MSIPSLYEGRVFKFPPIPTSHLWEYQVAGHDTPSVNWAESSVDNQDITVEYDFSTLTGSEHNEAAIRFQIRVGVVTIYLLDEVDITVDESNSAISATPSGLFPPMPSEAVIGQITVANLTSSSMLAATVVASAIGVIDIFPNNANFIQNNRYVFAAGSYLGTYLN